jgi:hypothetical protein
MKARGEKDSCAKMPLAENALLCRTVGIRKIETGGRTCYAF